MILDWLHGVLICLSLGWGILAEVLRQKLADANHKISLQDKTMIEITKRLNQYEDRNGPL